MLNLNLFYNSPDFINGYLDDKFLKIFSLIRSEYLLFYAGASISFNDVG